MRAERNTNGQAEMLFLEGSSDLGRIAGETGENVNEVISDLNQTITKLNVTFALGLAQMNTVLLADGGENFIQSPIPKTGRVLAVVGFILGPFVLSYFRRNDNRDRRVLGEALTGAVVGMTIGSAIDKLIN